MTRGELAIMVAGMLGLYDGEIDPTVQATILATYDGVYQELLDDGLATWPQSGEGEDIPRRFANSVAALVAGNDVLTTTYPQEAAQLQVLMTARVTADRRIRKQLGSAQATETTTVEHF